jgi:hypothetical protein
VKCTSHLMSISFAHLIAGLHSSRAGALSVDREESVDSSIKNVALDSNVKLAITCGNGYYSIRSYS